MPPGSRAELRIAVQPLLLRLRTGRASPAPANREDVGGPRAPPPRPENDLGREVTCSPDGGAAAAQEGGHGTEEGRLVRRSGPRPRTAAPPPQPPTCDRSRRRPVHPRPSGLGAAGPRASGCPASGDARPPPLLRPAAAGRARGAASRGGVPGRLPGAGRLHPRPPGSSRPVSAGSAWAGQPREPSGCERGAETEIRESLESGGFPTYVSAWWASPPPVAGNRRWGRAPS